MACCGLSETACSGDRISPLVSAANSPFDARTNSVKMTTQAKDAACGLSDRRLAPLSRLNGIPSKKCGSVRVVGASSTSVSETTVPLCVLTCPETHAPIAVVNFTPPMDLKRDGEGSTSLAHRYLTCHQFYVWSECTLYATTESIRYRLRRSPIARYCANAISARSKKSLWQRDNETTPAITR